MAHLIRCGNAIVGAGALRQLGVILRERSVGRVILFSGKSSYRRSGAARIMEPILRGILVTQYSDCPQNPGITDVRRAAKTFDTAEAELVIAIGGGTVLDMAKMANFFAAIPGMSAGKSSKTVEGPALPLVAIPTTAGTGSEATHFATYYENGAKQSLAHDSLRPDVALIDHELTHSLSPRITAETGFDALGQAIESFWAVAATQPSQALAQQSLKLALGALRDAVLHPTPKVRADMALAAWLAGRACDISKTTAPHALSYALTYDHGIPHGHAVAMTLGTLVRFNSERGNRRLNDPRGPTYVDATMAALIHHLGCNSPGEAADLLYRLMEEIGLDCKLPALGVPNPDVVNELSAKVNIERLDNNPVSVTKEDVLAIYRSLF